MNVDFLSFQLAHQIWNFNHWEFWDRRWHFSIPSNFLKLFYVACFLYQTVRSRHSFGEYNFPSFFFPPSHFSRFFPFIFAASRPSLLFTNLGEWSDVLLKYHWCSRKGNHTTAWELFCEMEETRMTNVHQS